VSLQPGADVVANGFQRRSLAMTIAENAADKHWSKVEYLHETVRNPNIHIRGTHSYYSDAWSGSFEHSVVRYLHGDDYGHARRLNR
jgi:hypothetical protein